MHIRLGLIFIVMLARRSEQASQCVASAIDPNVNKAFSFTLATFDTGASSAPAACYYACKAHIQTASVNKKDYSGLTLWDKAAPYLASKNFLTHGESYIINHLGMPDSQGGNGLGCFEFLSPSTFRHHPLSSKACQKASKVVCGNWDLSLPPISASSSLSSKSEHSSSVHPHPSSPGAPSASSSTTKSAATPVTEPTPVGTDKEFQVSGEKFRLIHLPEKVPNYQVAEDECKKHQSKLGAITSDTYPLINSELLNAKAVEKIVVGSWNGDGYSLSGPNCLILQTENSIFPGSCADTNAVLCQYEK